MLLQKFLADEKLWNAFKKKENSNMNRICWKDVKNALKDLDESISNEEIEKIMKFHEKKSEQYICFKEFRNMFLELVDNHH